jgi:hypothetical protein
MNGGTMNKDEHGWIGDEPNKSYCDRLVELAFPESVWIEGESFKEAELELRLQADAAMLDRLTALCLPRDEMPAHGAGEQKTWKLKTVMETIFPNKLILDQHRFQEDPKDQRDAKIKREALRHKLREALLKDPKLQQLLGARRYYMPSKWLVEQEWKSRHPGKELVEDVYDAVAAEKLLGVCFSGGGIRSATFNLGVLQGLAQLGLLPHVNYLSTVSGGGYIHEFLAGWILRNGNQRSVVKELIPQAEPGCLPRAAEPIQWLKRYASYLTPQRGIFSADTWTMLAIWFRNTVLNQIPLLATLGIGLILVHLLVPQPVVRDANAWGKTWPDWAWQTSGVVLLVIFAASLVRLWWNIALQEERASARNQDSVRKLMTNTQVVWWIIVPWLTCAVWLSFWAGAHPRLGTVWDDYWSKLQTSSEVFWRWFPIVAVCGLLLALTEIVIFAAGALDAWRALRLHPSHKLEAVRSGRKRVSRIRKYLKRALPQNKDARKRTWSILRSAKKELKALAHEVRAEEWELRAKTALAAVLLFLAGVAAAAIAIGIGCGFVWACGKFAPWLSCKIGDVSKISKEAAAAAAATAKCCGNKYVPPLPISIDPWRIEITLLPVLLLSVPYVAIEMTLGLLGRDYRDMEREWLARLRAWSALYGMLWTAVVGLALLGPYVGIWVSTLGATGKWGAAIAFVVSHLTTVLGGASSKSDGKPRHNGILGYSLTDLLALVAAPFAMAGFLLLISWGACEAVNAVYEAQHAWAHNAFWLAELECLAGLLVIAAIMGLRIDINEFSMHTFYKNRLSRCYLGAVVPGRREPDPFSGFDARGQVTLNSKRHTLPPFVTELLPKGYVRPGQPAEQGAYDGPFPIFCATLNLTTGEDLATQERKGTSFAFTPLYSGYTVGWTDGRTDRSVSYNGYVPTDYYAYPKRKDPEENYTPLKDREPLRGGIHIDSAVAISGAAANPNMGYNSNPALAFLMTLFNVRLGWWISNPRRMDKWQAGVGRATPVVALFSLFQELFGAVGDAAAYVNLSDGGHFENMGLYELVRRRCRYIVVCDAESDADMDFGGMGAAITKCRADFGAEIDLDLRPLRMDEKSGYSNTHCVVGTVRYPPPWAPKHSKTKPCTECPSLTEPADDPYTGVIVYFKSSLVGDEPADLLTYKLKYPVFPQDSTANQWFTETQFEAYRRLGHHVAMTGIQPALSPQKDKFGGFDKLEDLFDRMYAIWYPRTPEMEQYLQNHLGQLESLLNELRQHPELAGLEAALTDPTPGEHTVEWIKPHLSKSSLAYALQFSNSLLEFMAKVYINLDLAFPDNRVSPHAEWWICFFRRWCRVDVVRNSWQHHKACYPLEFRLFAERELGL